MTTSGDTPSRFPGVQSFWPAAAALLTIFALVHQEDAPLTTRRPGDRVAEKWPTPPTPSGIESVFARLWEDPLTAAMQLPRVPRSPRDVFAQIVEGVGEDGKILVLPVLVPGGPNIDAAEDRVRTNYAVLSALSALGFTLSYGERMSAVTLPGIFVKATRSRDRATAYARNDITVPMKMLAREKHRTPVAGPGAPPNQAPWFDKVILLWINDTVLGVEPLHAIGQIVMSILGKETIVAHPNRLGVAIVGPFGSDRLVDILDEDAAAPGDPEEIAGSPCAAPANQDRPVAATAAAGVTVADVALKVLIDTPRTSDCPLAPDESLFIFRKFQASTPTIFSPRATVATFDDLLANKSEWKCLQSRRGVLRCGVRLTPTIGSDLGLARALVEELRGRLPWTLSPQNVVLIGERDTVYGQKMAASLGMAFEDEPRGKTDGGGREPKAFFYSRGLDGQLASAEKPGENKVRAPDAAGGKTKPSDLPPHGNHQLDYLRRIADDVVEYDRDLARKGDGHVRAIGVVGTDIYDKLLVLRSLRSRFSDAVFFTTDLDAALWHQDERPYTQNTVVASHFDLHLELGNLELAEDCPPFRDSYQTSTYLATLLSVGIGPKGEVIRDSLNAKGASAGKIDWDDPWGRFSAESPTKLHGNLYEIGRSGPWLLSRPDPREAFLAPHVKHPAFVRNAVSTALAALVLLFFAARYYVPSAPSAAESRAKSFAARFFIRPALILGSLLLAGGAALIILIAIDSGRDTGEPFAMAEGLSIWPSVLIRYLATAIAATVLVMDRYFLKRRYEELRTGFKCPARRETEKVVRDHEAELHGRKFWARVLLHAGAYFAFGMGLFYFGDAFPGTPSRGRLAFNISLVVTMMAVFGTLLVTFYVLESLHRSKKLGHQLREELRSIDNASESATAVLQIVQFFALYTQRVGRLIYYPFILILLMAAARHPIFDNWSIPWPLVLLMTLVLAGTVLEAVRLRRAAFALRESALERQADWMLATARAGKPGADGADPAPRGASSAELKETMQRIQNERRGAFSPVLEDPVLAAVAIPFGGTGTMVLLERFLTSV